MKAAKITAKLRDAVPVCLYADGNEQGRYKNIELPDSIKALEIMDFQFDIDATGWISFHLYFDQGILPEELPAPKPPVTREQKRAAKAAKHAEMETQPGMEIWSEPATEENAPEHPGEPSDDIAAYLPTTAPAPGEDYTIATAEGTIIAEIHHEDLTAAAPEPEDFTIRFDVPGKKRSKLAQAIGEALAREIQYLGAPSYAYRIGAMTLDREGILHAPTSLDVLLPQLPERGFTPAE